MAPTTPIIPLPNTPLGTPPTATPADAGGAPNWAHLMIRLSEFFIGGIVMLVGVGGLLRHATGGVPSIRKVLR